MGQPVVFLYRALFWQITLSLANCYNHGEHAYVYAILDVTRSGRYVHRLFFQENRSLNRSSDPAKNRAFRIGEGLHGDKYTL